MALSRRTGQRFQASIWPGFVDAMTGLLLVLMFVLTIFMVVQFTLQETITGQETELDSLSSEVAALSASDGAPHAPQVPLDANGYFQPPEPDEIPDGPFGESIRRGREIFLNPAANATDYVGNSMACANCHLDAGRRANAAPMWAASVRYPTYRGKNEMINTMEDRVKGCSSTWGCARTRCPSTVPSGATTSHRSA